jgi:hypothetical protein
MRFPSHTIALFLFPSLFCNAQEYEYIPFPTENAQWNSDGYDGNCLPPGLCFQTEVAIIGDTVVNGHTYSMIGGLDNGVPWGSSYVWFREDVAARKVYAMWPSSSAQSFDGAVEYVAYDFSLSVGDTFMVPLPLNMTGLPGTHHYVITSIDTILVEGVLRKRFWFNPSFLVSSNYWIEGIGGEPGPFMTHYMFEGWNVLRCMYHEGELIYSNPLPGPPEYNLQTYPWYEYCDTSLVGIVEVKKSIRPTTLLVHGSEVRIPEVGMGTSQYALYSLLGQQLMEGNLIGDALQLPYLPPGIYVLRISGTHRQTVFKLINP